MEERRRGAVVGGWVMEFVLRQPGITDSTLNSILRKILINNHTTPPSFSLYNSLLLRRLQTETFKPFVSRNILDLFELSEELRHLSALPVTHSMRSAYRIVAQECGVWAERVAGMSVADHRCGLVTDEDIDTVTGRNKDPPTREEERERKKRRKESGEDSEREKPTEEERRENGKEDAMEAVRAYVAEAWEELGPSFLEVVAGIFGVVELQSEGITKEVVRSENNQVLHQYSMNNDGNNVSQLPRRKIVAKNFFRGAKITETEQIKNRDLLKRYDCVSTPAYDKLQEAPTTSSLEPHDVVKDPLPEALQFAERVILSNKKDNIAPTNNASNPSTMLRNSTACSDEWGDSIENFSEGDSDIRRSRIKLPPPKNIVVSPLKEHVMKNFVGRRTIKKWSVIEEVTLRTGVEKYGKGCWKTILDSYRDIFKDRTDCDLKDKWRNMTRYKSLVI